MTYFSIADGTLYVSTDNGIGAFELLKLTDLQNPNKSETGIRISRRGMPFGLGYGLALTDVYVTVKPHPIRKLH